MNKNLCSVCLASFDNEDELFYVVKGNFDMGFRDKTVTINEGEFIIVPRGVEHRLNATEEVHRVI